VKRHRLAAVPVVLYTRPSCTLCEQAAHVIRREAKGCAIETVDIGHDDTLLKRYGLRIPVVSVNGVDIAEGHVAPGLVRAAVRQAARTATKPRVPRWRFWA